MVEGAITNNSNRIIEVIDCEKKERKDCMYDCYNVIQIHWLIYVWVPYISTVTDTSMNVTTLVCGLS